MRTIIMMIKVVIATEADADAVSSEMDYTLEHEDIIETEILGYQESG